MVWHVWARRNSLERIAGTSCQVRPQLLSLRNLLFSPTILKCLYSTLAQSKNKTSSACYGSSCLTAWHPQEHSRTKSTKHMCGLYEVVGMWLSCLGTVVPCFSQGIPGFGQSHPCKKSCPINPFPTKLLWCATVQIPSLQALLRRLDYFRRHAIQQHTSAFLSLTFNLTKTCSAFKTSRNHGNHVCPELCSSGWTTKERQ